MRPSDKTDNASSSRHEPKSVQALPSAQRRMYQLVESFDQRVRGRNRKIESHLNLLLAETDDGQDVVEDNTLYQFYDDLKATTLPEWAKAGCRASRKALKTTATARALLATRDIHLNDEFAEDLEWCLGFGVLSGLLIGRVEWDPVYEVGEVDFIDPRDFDFDPDARKWSQASWCAIRTYVSWTDFVAMVQRRGRKIEDEVKIGRLYRQTAKADAKGMKSSHPLNSTPEANRDDKSDLAKRTRMLGEYLTIYEVYDFDEQKVYHFINGVAEPLMARDMPYTYMPDGRNIVVTRIHHALRHNQGVADATLAERSIKNLKTLRTGRLHTALTHGLPRKMYDKSGVHNPEALESKIRSTGPGEWIGVETRANRTLGSIVLPEPVHNTSIDYGASISDEERNLQKTLAVSDAERGAAGANFATEVAVAEEAKTKLSRRRRAVVDRFLARLVHRIVSLHRQYMPEGKVVALYDEDKGDEVLYEREAFKFLELGEGGKDPERKLYTYYIEDGDLRTGEHTRRKHLPNVWPVFAQGVQEGAYDKLTVYKRFAEAFSMGDATVSRDKFTENQQAAEVPPTGAPPVAQESVPQDNPGEGLPEAAVAPMLGGEVAAGAGSALIPTDQGGAAA